MCQFSFHSVCKNDIRKVTLNAIIQKYKKKTNLTENVLDVCVDSYISIPFKKNFQYFFRKRLFPDSTQKSQSNSCIQKKDEIKIKTSLPSKCSFPNFQVINCLRSNESLFRIHVFTSFNQISKEPINMIKDRNMLLIRARRLVLYS